MRPLSPRKSIFRAFDFLIVGVFLLIQGCGESDRKDRPFPDVCIANDSVYVISHRDEHLICRAVKLRLDGKYFRQISGDLVTSEDGDVAVQTASMRTFATQEGIDFDQFLYGDAPEMIVLLFEGSDTHPMQFVLSADTLEPLFGRLRRATSSKFGLTYNRIELNLGK